MAAARSPCGGFKTSVLHFKVKNTPSNECSVFFLWRKGSFSSRNRPSRNSTLFSSRRSAWSVLKCNQGSEVFQVHFALYGQENYVFEREFMYLEIFHRRSLHFFFGAKEKLQNAPRFEMDFVLNLDMC